MKQRVIILSIIAVVVLSGSIIFVVAASRSIATSRLAQQESAQRALFDEAQELLISHYLSYGEYPEHLDVLKFTFPDGGNSELLKDFDYVRTDSGYRLRTIGYNSQMTIETSRSRKKDPTMKSTRISE